MRHREAVLWPVGRELGNCRRLRRIGPLPSQRRDARDECTSIVSAFPGRFGASRRPRRRRRRCSVTLSKPLHSSRIRQSHVSLRNAAASPMGLPLPGSPCRTVPPRRYNAPSSPRGIHARQEHVAAAVRRILSSDRHHRRATKDDARKCYNLSRSPFLPVESSTVPSCLLPYQSSTFVGGKVWLAPSALARGGFVHKLVLCGVGAVATRTHDCPRGSR